MADKSRRRIPSEKAATPSEVYAAKESLSAVERYRLKSFAAYRIRGLGRAAHSRTYKDLLGEAYVSTIAGADGHETGRRWEKNRVSFSAHILGAMRSISSHWLETYQTSAQDLERLDCEVSFEDEEGILVSPITNAADPSSNPFRSLAAKEVLEALDKYFEGDDDARLVIEAKKEGWTVPEIVSRLGLSEKNVHAALQRIRYYAKGLL